MQFPKYVPNIPRCLWPTCTSPNIVSWRIYVIMDVQNFAKKKFNLIYTYDISKIMHVNL